VQNGTYLRNGPGLWDVGGGDFHHLFDGYATLVRVSFRQGRATGAHRQIESDAYASAVASGRPVLREFSQCPKPGNLLDRVSNAVGILSGAVLTDNPNSAVLPLGDGRVLCLTETTKSSILIDPDTLATVGKFQYADALGGMMIQSAHPIVTESELLTVLPDLARPGHLVVRMAAGSDERKVVGRVGCRGGPTPGWLHSFAVTENYVVVPEMPLRYSASSLVKSELAPYYAFEWLPASGSYMHVMCRSTGKTVII
jgi:carlactone synthase/all-trans-10'-apo-beta-carotenal 13,14-cleaving dioxygenase